MCTITTQLPDDLATGLDKLTETDGRTRSWLVREALADYLAQRREAERLTMEGIEAIRNGELAGHEDISAELDAWGPEPPSAVVGAGALRPAAFESVDGTLQRSNGAGGFAAMVRRLIPPALP